MRSTAPAPDPAVVAIGVCTFRRRESLLRTLKHLRAAVATFGRPAVVIVVDNDGEDPTVGESVRAFAAESRLELIFEVESRPGIAAARNRVFSLADARGAAFMAMLDDDEWPTEQWLVGLFAEQAKTGAVVVGGPVSPVFPPSTPQLQRYERYWSVAPQLLDGRPFVFCTCNFLIDLRAIREVPRPLFEDRFGLSGGGDTVFFRGLFFAGHAMAWSEQAQVHEEVPPSRASVAWIRTRRFRVGNHAVHWESIGHQAVKSFLKTLGLTARLVIYPLLGREPESRFFGWLLEWEKVRGRFAAHFGRTFVEYARPSAPGEKACR